MRHIERKIDGYDVTMESFTNFKEFLNVNDNREVKWYGESTPAREARNDSWRGCASYDEARNLLEYGCTDGLSRVKSRVGELQNHGTRKKMKRFNDVVGYAPIVANALMGIPNAMVNCERRMADSKIITIVYEPSVSCMGSKEQVLEFGCNLANAVMNLEENGYRVRLDYLNTYISSYGENKIYFYRLPIKNERQPINLKRILFPLSHVSMQRLLGFDWLERLPNGERLRAYGHSLYRVSPKELKIINEFLDPNEYLVYYGGSSVNDILKQLDVN